MILKLRDPVHNFIELNETEVKLINTQPLQRLRGIKQLALASLLYPGAIHTRFDHTLGVTHVAGAMAHSLGLDSDEIGKVRLAALLHDIGHGPFSHVSERALIRFADRTKLPQGVKIDKIHELVTARLIENNKEIVDRVGRDKCRAVVELLSKGIGQPALKSIVSGPLDADKQDYLLRDSKFCGVQYGVFDIHQFHRSLVLVGENDEKELMIASDGVHTVEQFVLAKYYLTTNVYRHKVRIITDEMIVRAITLGVERDGNQKLRKLYAFDNTNRFAENYIKWDDARFMCEFADSGKCGELLTRLQKRHLLKRVFKARIADIPARRREAVKALGYAENIKTRASVEAEIAKAIKAETGQSIDADFVIVHSYSIKSARETSRNDEAGISVDKSPAPVKFLEASTLFKSIDESMKDDFVEVYAPVEWKDETEKKTVRRDCQNSLQKILSNVRLSGETKK